MSHTLLIFDIDGTLVHTRAGRLAFDRAFAAVFGLQEAAATVHMAGRTDPAIFGELCERHSLDPGRFGIWKLEFLSSLAAELQRDPGKVLPGVRPLLEKCAKIPACVLALGTGNVEEGARLKLAPHGLNPFFRTGGFGADGIDRADIIRRAIVRATDAHERTFTKTIVIGDTPLDIACARANECLALGVATGLHSAAELTACGAHLVLQDLADTSGILDWFETA